MSSLHLQTVYLSFFFTSKCIQCKPPANDGMASFVKCAYASTYLTLQIAFFKKKYLFIGV